MGVSLPGGRDARWEFLPTHASLPDQQEFFKRGQGKRGGYLLSVSARGLFGFDAMKKFEGGSSFEGVVVLITIIFLLIWLLIGCHPYPYKSIKADKTKHAQFR